MNVDKRSVSIIGCGWLGYPLAKELIALDWVVRGTTTSTEKIKKMRADGIEAYELHFPLKASLDVRLFASEYLIINFPPGRKNKDQLMIYAQSVQHIIDRATSDNSFKKIIFISSTSVYGAELDTIDELTPSIPQTDSGKEILKAESIIRNSNLPYIILRFGGLAGPGRHPGRFLAGRKLMPNGHQSVNFIHLVDAMGIIKVMLQNDLKNETFNAVAPVHPNKKEFYIKMANMINQSPPTFSNVVKGKKKEVQPDKLLNATHYKFAFPDPMHFEFI